MAQITSRLMPTVTQSYLGMRRGVWVNISILLSVFLLGLFAGAHVGTMPLQQIDRSTAAKSPITGSVHRLADTPLRNTAHTDEMGRPITKQQFIEPFVISNVAGFSVATLLPGQRVDFHEHDTMHEFFYILEGKGVFTIDGKKVPVETGTFLHLAPREKHGIIVPSDSPDGEMKMLLAGVVVDDR